MYTIVRKNAKATNRANDTYMVQSEDGREYAVSFSPTEQSILEVRNNFGRKVTLKPENLQFIKTLIVGQPV